MNFTEETDSSMLSRLIGIDEKTAEKITEYGLGYMCQRLDALQTIYGLSDEDYKKIRDFVELSTRTVTEKDVVVKFKDFQQVYDIIKPDIMWEHQEMLYMFFYGGDNQFLYYKKFAVGSNESVNIPVQNIVKEMILNEVKSYVVVHNHPNCSEVPTPSLEDISFTKAINEVSKMMDIHSLGSIVVNEYGFTPVDHNHIKNIFD